MRTVDRVVRREPRLLNGDTAVPPVLAITTDIGFYSMLSSAASSNGLRLDWARSFERAIEMSRNSPTAILVYDSALPDINWEWAVEILAGSSGRYRVLLAIAAVDEELWSSALGRRAYDVVPKSAGSAELQRSLRFAFLSLERENPGR